ncbi:MAG: hypothetical protein ACYSPI_14305 [Planctomycetota bacterium]
MGTTFSPNGDFVSGGRIPINCPTSQLACSALKIGHPWMEVMPVTKMRC